MPSLKCSTCGQRILHSIGLEICPNCGAPLAPQLTTPYIENTSSEDDIYAQMVVDGAPPVSNINSGDTSPFPTISPIGIGNQFPRGFPKRSPNLEGTVVLLESREEPKPSGGVSEAIFNTLLDFIWAIPGGSSSSQQSKEKDRVQVTRVRIRTNDGIQRDVRLEGRLTGVNIAQGDSVSLWGKERDGLLIFQCGYNQTTNGSIRTSKMASPRENILVLIVALAGILTCIYYYSTNHIPLWPH